MTLVIFALTYLGIAMGHIPGLKLNRVGIALLGAIAMMVLGGVATGTAVSYNPVASQWKGNAVAPATRRQSRGIRFGIGTARTRSDGVRLVGAAGAGERPGRGGGGAGGRGGGALGRRRGRDRVEPHGQARPSRGRRPGIVVPLPVREAYRRLGGERRRAGEHLEQHAAK